MSFPAKKPNEIQNIFSCLAPISVNDPDEVKLTHSTLTLPALSRADQMSDVLIHLRDIATSVIFNPALDGFCGTLFAEVTC